MIRVLVVDDSATVRRVLSEALAAQQGIAVVGTAPDPYVARDRIAELKPDVLTLDIEMPRMDGLSFLAKLMQHYPLPVVVLSSLTPAGSELAMRAYELGAVEVLCKPSTAWSVDEAMPALVRALHRAAAARILPRRPVPAAELPPLRLSTTNRVLAIGASTGGTEALRALFARLPADTPGTVVVQHMPAQFTAAFAERLSSVGKMRVAEAQGGEELLPGLAFVAPGGRHLVVERSGARYLTALRDGPPVHFQKPAVDVLFYSVARAAGANAVGVLLTGMGADGAAGLKAMREAGAHTIAQDEASSVVFGMPKAAIELGAAVEVAHLDQVPERIVRAFQGRSSHAHPHRR
ncbi:MAG: chemotaxis response regulator protein-glutamate methylesterase [Planctomycetota bacterium]|nr:chemotaxis response regulator protein-glutamate methylesterase [Planctomycetota bacterium]MDW8372771.1 chemotaxis response regulator protein-glutamate methylesterase [Planctomycetota bacterium]